MATRAALRAKVRRLIRDVPNQDTLNGAIGTTSATSFTVSLGSFSGAPMLVQIGDELIFCPTYDSTTLTYSNCVRGFAGTTATTHLNGAAVLLAPRWTNADYNDAIDAAIRRMNALGLFRMKTVDLTYNSAYDGYNLASDVIDVYEILAERPDASRSWREIASFEVQQDHAAAEFASGIALRLNEPGYSGQALRVKYRARYGLFTDDSTDSSAATIGLQSFVDDLPVLGAGHYLLALGEAGRTQLEMAVEMARTQAVPPGHFVQASRGMEQLFQQRVAEAKLELRRTYPIRTRTRSAR